MEGSRECENLRELMESHRSEFVDDYRALDCYNTLIGLKSDVGESFCKKAYERAFKVKEGKQYLTSS